MEALSVSVLKRRLKRASWLPLAIIVATLIGAMAFVLKQHFDERLRNMRLTLGDIIESQQGLVGQEVLLNQPQAIEMRVASILANWRAKYSGAQACIGVSYREPYGTTGTIERCAIESETPRAAFSRVPGAVTQVGTEKEHLASIRHTVIRPTRLSDLFPLVLIGTLLLAMLAAGLAYQILVRRVERTVLNPLLDKISSDQRNAAAAETARMLAHDLRRPFQSLRIALKTMLDSPNEIVREIGAEICADVEGSIHSANAMLNDILEGSGELALDKEDLLLKKVATGITESVLQTVPDRSFTVIYDYRHEKMVSADREKIARVLTNLVENAVQALGSYGRLEVRTGDAVNDGAYLVKVSVLNSGPAIPANDLASLFSPYFTRREGGTGLGLWISKKIVEAHGGQIGCNSGKDGLTEFWFTLPATSRTENSGDSESKSDALSNLVEKNILVFDDERYVHAHWRQYAADHSYHDLCHFMSWEDFVGQDAFALAKGAIAFVDIQFTNSRYDGLDIARSLRQLGVMRIYAITSAMELARDSNLFDEVFGKEIPANFSSLVG